MKWDVVNNYRIMQKVTKMFFLTINVPLFKKLRDISFIFAGQ
jgi:hypothetical protein